jgi:hypothetical protein
MAKACRVCGIFLDLSKFPPSKLKKHEWICTPCHSLKKKTWDKEHPDKCKLSGRLRMRKWRELNPHQIATISEQTKERKRQYAREYYKKHTDIKKVHLKTNYAIKTGKLERKPCIVCGKPEAQAHHEDYLKPLEIIWLCPQHHKRRHSWIT